MSLSRHRLGPLLVVLLTTLLLVPGGVLVDARAQTPPSTAAIVDVFPRPYEVVQSGAVLLTAVVTEADAGTAEVFLDGVSVGTNQIADGRVGMALTLAPGDHELRVDARPDDGGAVTRTWSVTAVDVAVMRVAGDTRVDTAAAVADGFARPRRATSALIVRSDGFADGLAGGPLAASLGAPLLLSDSDRLSPAAARVLQTTVEPGSEVLLLGGTSALSTKVAQDLRDGGWQVRRLSGSDRYATAALVAAELPASDRAFLVSGQTFPDALAASAIAARDGIPVLLTAADRLPAATRAALTDRQVDDVTVAGGTQAVAPRVLTDAKAAGVTTVTRVAGEDRYETATRLAETFLPEATTVVLASGQGFPDALAGGPYAAAIGAPILLTGSVSLPTPTTVFLQKGTPRDVRILGGPVAIGRSVEDMIRPVIADDPAGAAVVALTPPASAVQQRETATIIILDQSPTAVRAHVVIGGREVLSSATVNGATVTVELPTADAFRHAGAGPLDVEVLLEVTVNGLTSHPSTRWVLDVRDPVYAVADGIALYEPSTSIDMIGFHQANHDGARNQVTTDNGVATLTMSSRGRNTGLNTAADIVAEPGVAIVSPTTGTVVRGGSYVLYCKYTDNFLVIEPDDFPGYEVKLLHFQGLTVGAGDRVEAGVTVIGSGPTQLPFRSQVDEHSTTKWPHVHIEVVDTSIPDKPNGGSGSDGC